MSWLSPHSFLCTPVALMMNWTETLIMLIEHWTGLSAFEPGFAGDTGAIEVILIDD